MNAGRPSRGSRLYRALLRTYPEAYRARFGDEMLATFRAAQADAARDGPAAWLLFWLRELRDWPACLAAARAAEEAQMLSTPAPGPGLARPGGRWTSAETRPVLLLFLSYGLTQTVATYVFRPYDDTTPLRVIGAVSYAVGVLGLPLAGLLAAALLRFPRWGYVYLGASLAVVVVLAIVASDSSPAVGIAIMLALAASLAVPGVRRLVARAWQDPTLFSLAVYGFLPVAVLFAFDDIAPLDDVAGYLVLSWVALPAGAWLFTAARRSWQKYLALWLTAMLCLLFAVLEVARVTGGIGHAIRPAHGAAPAGYILSLMRYLTVLLLAPALLALARRLRLPRRPSPAA